MGLDLQEFERIESTFQQFHAHFAPVFGRKQWRERSRDYLRGLLVQSSERANAENLAEAVEEASPRALQRFLTEATWEDAAVCEALQQYAAPRLTHPEAVWTVDGTDFPKQGKHSVGVARQYCGALGKIANCQAAVFLAYSSPRGRVLVDKRLYLPQEWTEDPARCTAAGVPEAEQVYLSKTDLALRLLLQAQRWGGLTAAWVTGDDHFGQSPTFRNGVAGAGWKYVLEVPGHLMVWPEPLAWEEPPYQGTGRPRHPRPLARKTTIRQRQADLPTTVWHEITVGDGAQGPRTYRFAFERVREGRDRRHPGDVVWLIHKTNLDGGEPRTFFSNAPEDTPHAVLARVAMSRWPIETEFEDEKSGVGLDEYEVRSWAGWHHHITLCMLASLFLLTLQQDWGEKDAADYPTASPPHRLRTTTSQALATGRTAPVVGTYSAAQRRREAQPCPAASPRTARR